MNGTVLAIHIRPSPGSPTQPVPQVQAVAGRGLVGDHTHDAIATSDKPPRTGKQITLIESEALDAIARESSLALSPAESRRNITTRGIALNHLVDREFRIGEVLLRGDRLCEPCSHLEGLTRKGICSALVHRGGLRATILRSGTIRTGDTITVSEAVTATA